LRVVEVVDHAVGAGSICPEEDGMRILVRPSGKETAREKETAGGKKVLAHHFGSGIQTEVPPLAGRAGGNIRGLQGQ